MATPDPSLRLGQLTEPVRLHSRALDEDLWIVPDEYDGPDLEGAVYTASECRLLAELAPSVAELAAIHRAKVHLDAALVRDVDRSGLRQTYRRVLSRYRELERQCDQGHGTPESEAELVSLGSRLSDLGRQLGIP